MTFSALDSTLLGPLFTTPEMAAVFSDRAKIAAMLACEAALARAQAGLGMAPPELAPAIEAVQPGQLNFAGIGQATSLAGVATIPFLKALQAHLPDTLQAGLHKGATTQDVVDTALVLQMRRAFALLRADLRDTLEALCALAQQHRQTPCIGRTYGQHAAPISFGFKVAVWAQGIAEVAAQLPALERQVLTASLFGPVGTLAAMGGQGPQVMQAFAAELKLGASPIAWHSLRGNMVAAGTWLATLAGALGKMATDIVFLAATEIGEVMEPYVAGRGGSSAMPHKRNPVGCTVILANASAGKGHVVTLLDAMLAAHERPAGLWHAEWHALPQLFGLAAGALREAKGLARGLPVDAARMLANLDITRGLLFADAAANLLAGAMGREAAHHCVEQAASRVRSGRQTLLQELQADLEIRRHDCAGLLAGAFELAPSLRAAAQWTDRGVAGCRNILDHLAAAKE